MRKTITAAIVIIFLVVGFMTIRSPQSAFARDEVNLKISSMVVGSAAYTLSFALAEIVNKNHPWIRLSCLEGRSSGGNLKLIAERPDARKDTIIYTNEATNADALAGKKPFVKPYDGARIIANMNSTVHALVTLDKNIKTGQDFIGKRYMTMRPGMTVEVMHRHLLNDIWKISDKVKVSYGDFGGIRDALADGLVDIGCLAFVTNGEDYWVPVPALAELMASKDVYFININEKEVQAMADATGWPLFYITMPPKSLGPEQTEPVTGSGHGISWWADESMDEEAVYEITKTIYDNIDKFQEYAGAQGKLITINNMTRVKLPDEMFHKGALKLYREKGMKIGF